MIFNCYLLYRVTVKIAVNIAKFAVTKVEVK